VAAVLEVFSKWKSFLGDRVEAAEQAGFSDESISQIAYHIGGFLSDKIDPANNEERVLKELWDTADDQEKKTLAKIMVKLAKTNS
jgi:hypothetical protein